MSVRRVLVITAAAVGYKSTEGAEVKHQDEGAKVNL